MESARSMEKGPGDCAFWVSKQATLEAGLCP